MILKELMNRRYSYTFTVVPFALTNMSMSTPKFIDMYFSAVAGMTLMVVVGSQLFRARQMWCRS